MSKYAYRKPDSELSGFRTFVTNDSVKGLPGDTGKDVDDDGAYPKSALPAPWKKKKDIGPTYYNKPDSTTGITDKPRTLPTEGEEYGVPSKTPPHGTLGARRTMTSKIRQRPVKRQRKQRGIKKIKSRQTYRKNKVRIKQKAKLRYKRVRNRPQVKRQKAIRRKNPKRFKRRRSQRELKVWLPGFEAPGIFEGISPENLEISVLENGVRRKYDLEFFTEKVHFFREEDLETVFDIIDDAVGPEELLSRVAAPFIYEVEDQDQRWESWAGKRDKGTPGPGLDTNSPSENKRKYAPGTVPAKDNEGLAEQDRQHGHGLDISPTRGSPGSGKVIPYNSNQFSYENRKAVKIAIKLSELRGKTVKGVQTRASDVTLKLQKYTPSTRTWTFKSGSGRTVVVKSDGPRIQKANVKVQCDCPFWVYQGPEHWAKQGKYLLGDPQGTATAPDAKDPEGKHRVCKHALAAFDWLTKTKRKKK